MAGDFPPRTSFITPPLHRAASPDGRSRSLGNRHPAPSSRGGWPPALLSPPFGSTLSFFPISEVCVLLQITSFDEQHSHRPASLSGKKFTWHCETVLMIIA